MPKKGPELALLERLKEVLGFYKYSGPDHTLKSVAQYTRVTTRTIQKWLKYETRPKRAKEKLIQEWLDSRPKAEGLEE